MLNVWADRTRPSLPQVQALYLRGAIQNDEYYTRCRNEGIIDQNDQTIIDDFLRTVPDGSRYVQYEKAGILTPGIIDNYYSNATPSDNYQTVCTTAGWWWNIGEVGPIAGGSISATIAQAEYYASLTWPSPSQAVALSFRLPAGRDTSWEPGWMAGLNFDDSDVGACFYRAGLLPKYQDHLASLNVRFPGVRQIKVMLSYGSTTTDQIKDWLTRSGYPQKIASDYVDALQEQERQRRLKLAISQSKTKAIAAWELGTISDQDVLDLFAGLGLQPDETQSTLSLAQAEYQRKRIDQATKVLRRSFLRGTLNNDQARSALDQLGLQSSRVDDMMQDWQFELTYTDTQIRAGQILKYALDGLISLGDVVTRLRNLNYNDEDIQVYVGELAVQAQNKQIKLSKQQQQLAEKTAKQLEQAAKQAKQAARQAQSDLSRHGNPRQLADWLCRGLISEDEARTRLNELGWPDPDIDRLIVVSCKDLSASQIADFAKKGLFTIDDALTRLATLKYTPDDAQKLLQDKGVTGV
jgi:hypothetical protein